jgi:hypothetical protein
MPQSKIKSYPRRTGGFTKDTQILMANGDIKAIKDITVGDALISGDGSIQKVEQISTRKVRSKVFSIRHRGNGDALCFSYGQNINSSIRKSTGHFYNANNKQYEKMQNNYLPELNLHTIFKFLNIHNIDLINYCPILKQEFEYGIFLERMKNSGIPSRRLAKLIGLSRNAIKRLQQHKNITEQTLRYYCGKKVNRHIKIDFNLGKLIGLFLAEGSVENNRVTFAFHIKEKPLFNFVTTILHKKFGISSKIRYLPEKKSAIVRTHSYILAKFIKKWCYNYNDKRILHKNYSLAYLKGVICGITLGDGHISKKHSKIVIGMSREDLIKDIYIASNICGIYPTMSKTSKRFRPKLKNKICTIKTITYQTEEFYKLLKILKQQEEKPEYTRKKSDRLFHKTFIWSKISNIKFNFYCDLVFKLKVSGLGSYIANFVVVQ